VAADAAATDEPAANEQPTTDETSEQASPTEPRTP